MKQYFIADTHFGHEKYHSENLQKENQQLKGSLQTYEILLKANVEENQKLKGQLQNISSEFLKYDWKTSNKEQIINQLESLYNSIFRE